MLLSAFADLSFRLRKASSVLTMMPSGWRRAILALLVAGCQPSDPREVPVERRSSSAISGSMEPVETVLHEYVPCDRLNPDCRPFLTTGKSIAFVFPEAFYQDGINFRGGPQSRVSLRLDRRDLSPLALKVKAADRAMFSDGVRSQRLRAYAHRNRLHVSVSTNANGFPLSNPWVERTRAELAGGLRLETGRLCGMVFTRKVEDVGEIVTDPRDRKAEIHGFVAESGGKSRTTGGFCSAHSPICLIRFDYRGFDGLFGIARENFCEWPQHTRRITGLLDRHLVRETQRRSPEQRE